jgi:cellulose synthase/poly-beta-1,6-N-acetylglucosamine synthase-like glycosyltransferase
MKARTATGSPTVTIVVPHYHDLAALELCLTALDRQTYPRDRYEIVVADNASPEGREAVEAVVGARGRLVVVTEKGAGPARNGGVAAATNEILAFTDCDCVPEPQWLAQGVAALAQADLAGGAMTVLVADAARPTPIEAFEWVFAFDNRRYVEQMGFTVTANLFCPAAVFAKVGGFKVGVSEDLEWSTRATAKGFRLTYAAGAVVGHPARRTWAELVAKWRRLNAESLGLAAERPGGVFRWTLRNFLLPLSAVLHTPKVLSSPALTSWSQRLAALGVLYRLRLWRFADGLRLLAQPRQA